MLSNQSEPQSSLDQKQLENKKRAAEFTNSITFAHYETVLTRV